MTAPVVKRGLQCDATHHIWRLGGLALAVYEKIGAVTYDRMTGGHGEWFKSIEDMAEYLGCNYDSCWEAFKKLTAAGWLTKDPSKNPWKSKNYQRVSHDDWVKQNPDKCFVKEKMIWDGESHDPLAPALWKASNGKVRFYQNMLTALRRTRATDEEIIIDWQKFLASTKEPRTAKQWQSLAPKFASVFRSRWASNTNGARILTAAELKPVKTQPVKEPTSENKLTVKPEDAMYASINDRVGAWAAFRETELYAQFESIEEAGAYFEKTWKPNWIRAVRPTGRTT